MDITWIIVLIIVVAIWHYLVPEETRKTINKALMDIIKKKKPVEVKKHEPAFSWDKKEGNIPHYCPYCGGKLL